MMFLGSAQQKSGFMRANTVVLASFCWFRCLHLRSSRFLSRGGFFYRLSILSADRYFAKIMLGCHVSFERISQKWCQNFVDNRMLLQIAVIVNHKDVQPVLEALATTITKISSVTFQEVRMKQQK